MEYIAHFVAGCPGSIRACHIRTWGQHADGMVFGVDDTASLQLSADGLIDLASRGIVGRDDDGVARTVSIVSDNRGDAFLWVGNFHDSALLFEKRDAFGDFAARKVLYRA